MESTVACCVLCQDFIVPVLQRKCTRISGMEM